MLVHLDKEQKYVLHPKTQSCESVKCILNTRILKTYLKTNQIKNRFTVSENTWNDTKCNSLSMRILFEMC